MPDGGAYRARLEAHHFQTLGPSYHRMCPISLTVYSGGDGSSDSAERIQQIEIRIEKASVQNSIDVLMADAALASIDAKKSPGKAAVQKWIGLPKKGGRRITAGGAPVDLADYIGLDADRTTFWYCYDSDGRVLEQKTPAGNCS
jgi:hypothetical protein